MIEEKGLTKMGYDNIIQRIIQQSVKPPDDKTFNELLAWSQGYAQCQIKILEIIRTMKDQYGR